VSPEELSGIVPPELLERLLEGAIPPAGVVVGEPVGDPKKLGTTKKVAGTVAVAVEVPCSPA
jgi:hypothetical protein